MENNKSLKFQSSKPVLSYLLIDDFMRRYCETPRAKLMNVTRESRERKQLIERNENGRERRLNCFLFNLHSKS